MDEEYQNYPERPEEENRSAKRRRWQSQRNADQDRMSLVTIVALGGFLAVGFLFLLLFPRSKVSEIEKRTLTQFPKFTLKTYFSGEFTEEVAKFYDDTVPWRDAFKNAGNNFMGVYGLSGGEDTITFINKPLNGIENGPADTAEKPTDEKPADPKPTDPKPTDQKPSGEPDGTGETGGTETEAPTEAPTEPPTEPAPTKDFTAEEAEFGLSNGLLVVYQQGHWKCLPLYGGGSGTAYANALNYLQEQVGSGVKIYSMPAPLSSQFYVPSNASQYSSDQSASMDAVAEKFDSRIVNVNVCSELAKHTEEEIYCRTDHHWQALGAYYSLKCFAEAAGVDYPDLETGYTKGVNEGYVGTMYAFSKDARILNDPEDFTYYVPKANYTASFYDTSFNYKFEHDIFFDVAVSGSYLMFIGSDEYVVKIDTPIKNGRKLLLVKDSYGNAEVPFLTGSFEQVYVADMRYFKRNLPNFIKTMGITDVLFSMCTYSVVGTNADNLQNLNVQDAYSEIVDTHLDITPPEGTEPVSEPTETKEP